MNTSNYTAITFAGPLRDEVRVPIEKAWAYFEEQNYTMHPLKAHTDDCADHWTWAKGYFVWDFTMERYRLVQIGLGANGDLRIDNPDLDVHQKPQAIYDPRAGWVRGINLQKATTMKPTPATCTTCDGCGCANCR